jgi:hypothetical protein
MRLLTPKAQEAVMSTAAMTMLAGSPPSASSPLPAWCSDAA